MMKENNPSYDYSFITGLSESDVYDNSKQKIIIISKDGLKLNLIEFKDSVEAKYMAVTSGGIAITLLVAIVTSSAKDIFGISAETWTAMFILAFILSAVITLYCVAKAVFSRKNRNIEKVCQKMMESKDTTDVGV